MGRVRGQLTTSASGGHDSDPLFQAWSTALRADGIRRHEEDFREDPSGVVEGDISDRALGQFVGFSYAIRACPW